MYLTRQLSGVTPPVIAGDKANLERRKQAQQAAACLIVAWAKGIGNDSFSLGIKSIPKPMTMVFVADISPLLIRFTDKCDIIQHDFLSGHLPWGEFFRARRTVLMPILRTRAVSRTPAPLNAISTILFAGFIGVGELKHVRTGGATIANMTGRGLAMAVYSARVATRTVNGDGCHEDMSLKSTHHTGSTDRRHHRRP
jgi:hypothetical protein